MLATANRKTNRENDYPTSDGKPMAETEYHINLILESIDTLRQFYADNPNVCVSGNLLLFYEKGNKRRHISPDCFVTLGVPTRLRINYLTWEEGKSPDVVFEFTSKSTRSVDTKKKFLLYQDVMKVPEYFLFDPQQDYLKPSMQGYRLKAGEYVAIKPVEGRIPSKVLGLHLERQRDKMRFWNPLTQAWLPTSAERYEAEAEKARIEKERANAAEAEVQRLRQLLSKMTANGHKNGANGKHD